jgi:hypothetical protein
MSLIIPVAPSLSAVNNTGFVITGNSDGNPSTTYYALMVVYGTSTFFANGTFGLSSTPVFLPQPAVFSGVSVAGIPPNTIASVSLAAALNAGGGGETFFGPASSATTSPNVPIAQPYQAIFSTTVTAYWLPNGNPTGTQYDVQLSPDPSFATGVIDSGWVTALTHQFINLLPDTIYYGRVKARNSVLVESPFITLGSVTTLTGPANVRALQVTNLLDDRGFLLEWAPNLENNIVSYKVYRSNSPTDIGSFALIGSVPSNVTSFIDHVPFTFGLVYYYIVTALDNGGNESSLDTANPTQDMSFHSFEEQPFPTVVLVSDLVNGETPSGLINGVNRLFTTAYPYKKGTLQPRLDGVVLEYIEDFVEGPLSQQFTLDAPPVPGEALRISYIRY